MQPDELDETSLALFTEAGVGKLADIQVNKDDIVTIAVARREQELLAQRVELEETLVRLRREETENNTALEEGIEAQVQGLSTDFDEVVASLTTHGFKGVKLDLSHSWSESKKDGGNIEVTVSISTSNTNGDSYSRKQEAISTSRKLKINSEGAERLRNAKKITSSIESTEKTLLSVRRDLGQLTSLERQAKAQVAMQLLSNSKVGQNLLKMMDKASAKLLTVKK